MPVLGHGSHATDGEASVLRALRARPEFQAGAAYLGAAWLLYDAADLVVFAFDLPETLLRVILVLLATGALLVLLLAHWLRLTSVAVRRDGVVEDDDIRGVPDFLESVLVRAIESVSRRTVVVTASGATVAFFLLFLFLWNSWAEAHERPFEDPRITLVVFPFGESGPAAAGLGSGLGELLTVSLDGTPGLRVVDPAAAWGPLEADETGAPRPPDPEEAREASRRAGASRFVTGDVVGAGSGLQITARVHRLDGSDAGTALRVSAHQDSLGPALDRLATRVVAEVWERDQLPTVPGIDRSATRSAEALKAYLMAKGAVRQGRLDDAREAVERAVALDSTFALAHLARFSIESRRLFAQGRPVSGVRPIIERAARHADRLTPRNRMRIDAHRALDATDGRQAAFLFERILAIDSLDVDALEGLAFTHLMYGWQLDADADDVVRAYRRVVRADPGNTVAMATLARLALLREDPAAAGSWVGRLERHDSLGAYARGTAGAYRIVTASEAALDSLLRRRAGDDVGAVSTVIRHLRAVRPALAERFIDVVSGWPASTYHARLARGARVQLWFARGRLSAVDSMVDAGEMDDLRVELAVYQVAAALAGVGDRDRAGRAARILADRTPVDSAEAHLASRDVWKTGWAVGAYHATFGDTLRARRWRDALGALPPGETTTVPEWPGALAADLEARLAARRGDPETARVRAREAFERWSVHAGSALESSPEPAMRLHLARQLRSGSGANGRARALYRSLTPPHTWLGFYTARATLELARLREAAGAPEDAARGYRAAIRLWEGGDAAVVGDALRQAREGLARTGAGG